MEYDYHEDYYSINTGAHRKAGIELNTPTLSHHLGFWFPNIEQSGEPSQPVRSVDKYGAMVDRYLKAIYNHTRDLDGFETNIDIEFAGATYSVFFNSVFRHDAVGNLTKVGSQNYEEDFAIRDAIDSDNRILSIEFLWQGLSLQLRFEFTSEFFTLSAFATIVPAGEETKRTKTIKAHLDFLSRSKPPVAPCGETVADAATRAALEVELKKINDYLYQDIWDHLFFDLTRTKDFLAAVKAFGDARGKVFADFRGIVIAGDDAPDKRNIQSTTIYDSAAVGEPFSETWPRTDLIPSFKSFLTCKDGLSLRRREFTASFMQGKRAVYITALGPQPRPGSQMKCAPLYYLAVTRPMNDWQLGALIDRLHYLGTVRLAALMELPALRIAGANLRDIEKSAELARKAIESDDRDTALRHYGMINRLIAHERQRDRKPIFWNGLQFRVERSRYYVSRFREMVKLVRVERIEGYQPYDLFVEYRLGGVYDYIDRLGRRQERAVLAATNLFQSMSLNASLGIIEAIKEIQIKAEIALIAVLVPYYLIATIHYIFEAKDQHPDLFSVYLTIWLVTGSAALLSFFVYLKDVGLQKAGSIMLKCLIFLFWTFAIVLTTQGFFSQTPHTK